MDRFGLTLLLTFGIIASANATTLDTNEIIALPSFEQPIDKSQIEALDQQLILSNFAVSATGYFYHRCTRISPIYDEKIQLVKDNLLTIFPTISSDLARTYQWQDNFEKLDDRALATLKVITAINRLEDTFTDEPLIDKPLCDSFIDNYNGENAKQNWLNYYHRALPMLIDNFNQTYKK